jgi:hypothetical protein
LLSLDNPSVKQAANQAVAEYAAWVKIPAAEVTTADQFMEAVAYYVHKHMGYVTDIPGTNEISAAEIISSNSSRCGRAYCGDCEDFAILRLALLRSLGVQPECAYAADHFGSNAHAFDIVRYYGVYRIMDYGYLGNQFTSKAQVNQPGNVWNDKYGVFSVPSSFPAELTWNYPFGPQCPSGAWSYNTYYTSDCP